MITYKCLVNGSIDAVQRERVVQGLQAVYRRAFELPADQLSVEFTEVPKGLWFTAGQVSKASMVLGSVPAGTSQPQRVSLMAEVCRMFSDATGAPYDDVMVVAADPRKA